MGVIDEIKQKLDLVEIVGQYVHLVKSGRTFRAPCPFHSEKKPSFFVYPEQQTWHCFGACNTGGDIFSFIMKKEGLSFSEALRFLAEKANVTLPTTSRPGAEDKIRDYLFQINLAAAQYFHNLLLNSAQAEKARRYLSTRGLNEKSISDFLLGYSLPEWESLKEYMVQKGFTENDLLTAGLLFKSENATRSHDRFRDHIMFPIADDRGRITGFGARVLDNSSPKYINSPQTPVFDKSGSLYGIHLAKTAIRQQDRAVLVEGYMDVIIAHQYGFNYVIAPMGISISEKQINQIKKLTRNITLALDPDTAGEEAAMRCINYENSTEAEVRVISMPEGKDPDELIKENPDRWKSMVENASPVIEYAIRLVTGKQDMKTSQGKNEALNRLLPIIAQVKAGTRQFDYITRLSLATGIEEKKLEAALVRYKADRLAIETKNQSIQKATRPILSSPLEEYTLSLLLHYPELKNQSENILPDYFENTINRAIFEIWQSSDDINSLRTALDPAIKEQYDSLVSRPLSYDRIQEKYIDCLLRLRERYLRNLQKKQAELLAAEEELGDHDAVISRLREQGTRINEELSKIFILRSKIRGEVRK